MNREQLTITLQGILSIVVAIEIQDSKYIWLIFGIISGIIALKHEESLTRYLNRIGKYVYKTIKSYS
jgi:hypothetical protein